MDPSSNNRRAFLRSSVTNKIFELFIKPFLQERYIDPASGPNKLHVSMESWFLTKERDISLYRATAAFKIIGSKWATLDTPHKMMLDGTGDRNVVRGNYLWVRFDLTVPDIVDVEYNDQVFKVRSNYFEAHIKNRLEFVC